jgi:hypothetical protein
MDINKYKSNSFSVWPFVLVLATAILCSAVPRSAQAQDWRFEPIVRGGAEYDDNGTLAARTDEEVELTGYLIDLWANINYTSPKATFFLQPRAVLRNYPDESEFDTNDYRLVSRFSRQGQSNTIGFRGRFDRQSIRTAERSNVDFEIEDPDEISEDSTGRVFLSGTRNRLRFTPYWDFQWSDVSSVRTELDYFDVGYDNVFAGLLVDYTDARLNLNYRRKFSRVNSALVTATARRYDADNARGTITGYGLMAGFDYSLSQKTRVKAMFGFEDAEQSGSQIDPEPIATITLSRNLQTIRMFAQYRRSISGGGGGGVSLRDSFNLNFVRDLSERIDAGLGVRAYRASGADDTTSIDDRNYVQLQSTFLWYLSRSFAIEMDYRYTVNDRSETFGGRSNSNNVVLWFVYQPNTIPRL